MFEKIKIEIPLIDVIQCMPQNSKFLKDVNTQKRFTSIPKNAYFIEVVHTLHLVNGVIKYKDPSTPKIEGTIFTCKTIYG